MAEHNPIRWTVEAACREFGANRGTLATRITAGGIVPGADKKYSTADICRAVFGDIDGEKLRSERHKANLLEMDEAERKGILLNKSEVYAWLDKAGEALRSNIMTCNISEEEKRDTLKAFQAVLEKI